MKQLSVKVLLSLLSVSPIIAAATTTSVPPIVRTNYDMQELATSSRLSNAELIGRRLTVQYCALCHDPVGQRTTSPYGPLLNSELLKALGEERARTKILEGSPQMPGFQYQLTPAEISQIFAYLKTVSLQEGSSKLGKERGPAASTEANRDAILGGTLRATNGDLLEGITVSARADGKTFTTTVFTDKEGAYHFPPLDRGKYRVWAQATGYETARAEVDLTARHSAQLPLKLAELSDPESVLRQLSGAEWLDALPIRTDQDKRIKEIFRLTCTNCHSASFVLQRRFDEQGWRTIIDFMQQVGHEGWKGTATMRPGVNDFDGHYALELAQYLTAVRGPDSPALPVKLLQRPKGVATQVVITGYDIPPAETPTELPWADGSDWTAGAASGMHGAVGIHDVAVDTNGNAWFTESVNNDARTITKVDANTGQVTGFRLPWTPPPGNSWNPGRSWQAGVTHGMAGDSQGNLWFGIGRTLGKIVPETEAFEFFTPPVQVAERMQYPFSVTVDVDAKDRIWFGAVNGVIRFDPTSQEFSYYQNPTPTKGGITVTYGMAGDSLGNGWWTTPDSLDLVKSVDIKTGKVREIAMRPPWAELEEALATPADREYVSSTQGLARLPGTQYPRRPGADKHGTAIWVPNWWGMNLAKIDIHSDEVTYYRPPFTTQPYAVTVDKHQLVWTNLTPDDRVASFDPKTKEWTIYRLPVNRCESRHISIDNRTGDVWVPCHRSGNVFRLQFRKPTEANER